MLVFESTDSVYCHMFIVEYLLHCRSLSAINVLYLLEAVASLIVQ